MKLTARLPLLLVISLGSSAFGAPLMNLCSEYPRLSLCRLRGVLDSAIVEINFLLNESEEVATVANHLSQPSALGITNKYQRIK